MRFVEEKALKDQFWKMYSRNNKKILAYQFECQARHGGVDLVTVEKVPEKDGGSHIEFCAFEFKLNDIEKVYAQAVLNAETNYFHKSFIVVPRNKKKVILDRYASYFEKYPFIGCIAVEHPDDNGGKYEMFRKAWAKKDERLTVSQEIIKLCLREI